MMSSGWGKPESDNDLFPLHVGRWNFFRKKCRNRKTNLKEARLYLIFSINSLWQWFYKTYQTYPPKHRCKGQGDSVWKIGNTNAIKHENKRPPRFSGNPKFTRLHTKNSLNKGELKLSLFGCRYPVLTPKGSHQNKEGT